MNSPEAIRVSSKQCRFGAFLVSVLLMLPLQACYRPAEPEVYVSIGSTGVSVERATLPAGASSTVRSIPQPKADIGIWVTVDPARTVRLDNELPIGKMDLIWVHGQEVVDVSLAEDWDSSSGSVGSGQPVTAFLMTTPGSLGEVDAGDKVNLGM